MCVCACCTPGGLPSLSFFTQVNREKSNTRKKIEREKWWCTTPSWGEKSGLKREFLGKFEIKKLFVRWNFFKLAKCILAGGAWNIIKIISIGSTSLQGNRGFWWENTQLGGLLEDHFSEIMLKKIVWLRIICCNITWNYEFMKFSFDQK